MFVDSVSSLPSIWASMNSWFTPTVLFVLLNVMILTIAFASSTTQKQQDPHHQQGLARSPSMLQRLKSINLYQYRSPEPHSATTFEKPPEFSEATHYAFQHTHEVEQPQFTRSLSLLQRLKSFNSNPPLPAAAAATSPHKTHVPESHSEQAPENDHFEDEGPFEVLDDLKHEGQESDDDEEEGEQTFEEVFSQLKPLQDHHVNRTTSDTAPASGEMPAKLPKKMKKSASSKSAFAHFQENDIVETRRPATVRERKAPKVAEDEEVDAKADDFISNFKNQLKLQRLDSILRYKDMISRGTAK